MTKVIRNSKLLKNKVKVYLAGAMEFAPDDGRGWRAIVQALLQKENITVFNPCTEEGDIFERYNFSSHGEFHAAKIKDYERFKVCMNEIAVADLKEIASSDYILAYITPDLGGGTPGEMTYARYVLDIPVIGVMHSESTVEGASGWVMACCDEIFNSLEEAVEYIRDQVTTCKGNKLS
jgi:nucleoside 2-deoxyribosyltransferase